MVSSAEEDLKRAQRELWDAFFRGDVNKLAGLLIPQGYVHTDIDGNVFDKKDWLSWLAGKVTSAVPPYSTDDVKVRFYGDTAVLTARLTIELEGKGSTEQIRVTNVWVKYAGKWLRVAYHATRITKLS